MICFDVALILLTGVMGQTIIPVPALGAVIGSVAGMIATVIIQEIWGDKLRELIMKINQHIHTLFEKIKDFFIELTQFLKRVMGPDLSEEELLEDEFGSEYLYKRLNGFNELNPENKRILDQAMEEVVYEDSKMGMEEALKMAKKDPATQGLQDPFLVRGQGLDPQPTGGFSVERTAFQFLWDSV